MMRPHRFALLAFPLLAACPRPRAAEGPALVPVAAPGASAPPLAAVTRAFDTRTGQQVSLDALLDAVGGADAVFVGEQHTDEVTHRVELAIYDGLLARRDDRVVLALEMFSRDVQPVLDRYVAGEIDEAALLAEARPWNNYHTGYRPLIERARRDRLPVVGSNAPMSVIRKVAFGGKEAYDGLTASERAFVAPELFPNSDAYWERFARVVRGHASMMIGDEQQRLYSTQSLWDNTMGFSCAEAAERYPGRLVLHVNGGFHSSYHDGTVAQFQRRRPGARVATIQIDPTGDLALARPDPDDAGVADYLVYVEQRARGLEDGMHAVFVGRELRYRLWLPGGARDDRPVPLLIWLGAEGTRAEDELAYWKRALGQRAAIAVVEMPYPQLEEQLYLSGRWFWHDSFREDLGEASSGIGRVHDYLTAHYPVDPKRVVLAGRGAGATVVAATALYPEQLELRSIAFAPARYHELRELALPYRPPPGALQVLAPPDDLVWWAKETQEYRGIGLDATAAGLDVSDPLAPAPAVERALGLEPEGGGAAASPQRFAVADGSPIARRWAELYALAQPGGGRGAAIVTAAELAAGGAKPGAVTWLTFPGEGGAGAPAFGAASFADGRALPLAPGPFGGTTVVVVPRGAGDAERAAWQALADGDAIKKRSRFVSLRVAALDGEPSLEAVLGEIRAANKSNVLIVPAVFCASADRMRELRAAAGDLSGLTVAWLPGLGARLGQLPGDEK